MQINRALKLNPFTKAAVEMALWDVAGKAAGQPLYRLLGGKVRDVLPMKMVVGAFESAERRGHSEQFSTVVLHLKVKVGLDPEQDRERVQAVRALAGPEVSIGIDAVNCGWNVTTARRMLREMEELNVAFAEQPVVGD